MVGKEVHAKLSLNEMDYVSKVDLLNKRLIRDMEIDVKNRSGDLNYEFLKQFQTHQRIIIEFAQNEVQYGVDDEIKEFSGAIIEENKQILNKTDKLLKEVGANLVEDKVKESAYFACYDEIYKGLVERLKSKEDSEARIADKGIDQDFLVRMVIHYEAMSEMLATVEIFTDSDDLKDFVIDTYKISQARLETLYEMVTQSNKKEDGS